VGEGSGGMVNKSECGQLEDTSDDEGGSVPRKKEGPLRRRDARAIARSAAGPQGRRLNHKVSIGAILRAKYTVNAHILPSIL